MIFNKISFFTLSALVVSANLLAADKPNIVIIVADDLGYASVSFNGGKVPTPAIDRIAEEGVQLGSFYACPVCSPTRAGLMTGRYPLRFGCMRAVIPPWRKQGMPASEKTIAELCAEAGYKRRAIIGKWHLGHSDIKYLPDNQGFTHFYGHYNGAIDYYTHEREGEVDWHSNRDTIKEKGYATDLLGADAVKFIDESSKEKEPFLLYLPFNAPHSPFQAEKADTDHFPEMKGNRKVYAGMVTAMDRAIKGVLDAIDRNDISENTFVLFFSDNGGIVKVTDNTPWRGGKIDVYEGGTRVAAAARWPAGGISGGKEVKSGPIGYIDVYPTIKAIIGLEDHSDPNPLDGINVLDIMKGVTAAPKRDWFSYLHQGGPDEKLAVINGNWKLVAITPDINGETHTSVELFNLEEYPSEKKNLANANPERTQEMLAKLRAFKKLQNNPVPQYGEGRKGFKAPKDWVVVESR